MDNTKNVINQAPMNQAAQQPTAQSMQGQGAMNAAPVQGSQLQQILQQVDTLRASLHNLVENESFADAEVVAASGALEGHLSRYRELTAHNMNSMPGLKTF